MSKVPLTFACGLYDRMLALHTGDVQVEGVDLNFLVQDDPRQIFDRMAARQEFDVCEFSSSEFISRFSAGQCPFVALPVFASRVFRHGFIYVNKKHIKSPKDLEGKRIGVPRYTMTAALFQRGLLKDEYGVDFSKVEWVEGDINTPKQHGSPTILPTVRPVSIAANTSGKSLSKLLDDGEIQGLIGIGEPDSFGAQSRCRAAVSRLSRGREGLLQAHQDLSDHAPRGDPQGHLREASVRRDQPATRRSGRPRTWRRRRCATAARCVTCCRGCSRARRDRAGVRRRSLALRCRAEPADARSAGALSWSIRA